MKKINLFFIALCIAWTCPLISQIYQGATATRVLYMDQNGIADTSALSITPIGEGDMANFNGSNNHTVAFEGTFYQVYSDFTASKLRFRKSSDGLNWSEPLLLSDNSVEAGYPDFASLTVWRADNQIKVGIFYSFISLQGLEPQTKFVLSTNGGNSFNSPIFISSYPEDVLSDVGLTVIAWNVASKGDTLFASWGRYYDNFGALADLIWFSRSFDGGLTWSPMEVAFEGIQYCFLGDCAIDENGDFYLLVANGDVFGSELVLLVSENAGDNWFVIDNNLTNHELFSGNRDANCQLNLDGDKIRVSYTHKRQFLDEVGLVQRPNSFNGWTTHIVSDTNALQVSDLTPELVSINQCQTSIARGNNGRIYISWVDSREFNSPNIELCDFNAYIAWSDDDGETWSPNYKLSLESNFGQDYNAYNDLAVVSGPTGDTVLLSWTTYRYITVGCTDPLSCSFNPDAILSTDTSCIYPGNPCDDGNPFTQNDVFDEECFCAGLVGVEYAATKFNVFPNPSQGLMNLQIEDVSKLFTLQVRDISGRLVYEILSTSGSQLLNLSSLNTGYYFIQLIGDGFSETKKIQLLR